MLSSDQKLSVSSFNIYSETRKSTRPKRVENDASARPPNLPSDPQRWSFHTLASWTIVPIFASKSVHFFSKYRAHKFGNRWTNGKNEPVENITPPVTLAWRKYNLSTALRYVGMWPLRRWRLTYNLWFQTGPRVICHTSNRCVDFRFLKLFVLELLSGMWQTNRRTTRRGSTYNVAV